MSLDPQLLEILACPAQDHAPLNYDTDAQLLTCTSCGRQYPVRDGLPILLLDQAVGAGTGGQR
jgi:uncharacterized protein YbaR (Trm112 family)